MKYFIIFGIIFTITGLTIIVINFSINGFSNNEFLEKINYEVVSNTYDESDSITINSDVAKITIITGDVSEVTIEYSQTDYCQYEISSEDGLLIKQNNDRPWYSYLNVFSWHYNRYITVTIPSTFNGDLIIDTDVGGIEIEDVDVNNIEIIAETTGIDIKNVTAINVDIKIQTGGVEINDLSCDILLIDTKTSGIDFDDIDAQEIDIKTKVGGIDGKLVGVIEDYTIFLTTTVGGSNISSGGSGSRILRIETTVGGTIIEFLE